jgi:hypothetical protein
MKVRRPRSKSRYTEFHRRLKTGAEKRPRALEHSAKSGRVLYIRTVLKRLMPLPSFLPVSYHELRVLWCRYRARDPDVQRLVLEVQRFRGVVDDAYQLQQVIESAGERRGMVNSLRSKSCACY